MNPDAPGPSLKARAIAYLSRREHSRQELRRKLAAHSQDSEAIEAVLDDLQREHWQSDQRYAQAYVNRTAPRQGARRILGTLRQHGVDDESIAALQAESAGIGYALGYLKSFEGASGAEARASTPAQMAATLYQLWLGAAMLTKLRRDASALQTAWQATLAMLQLPPDSYR